MYCAADAGSSTPPATAAASGSSEQQQQQQQQAETVYHKTPVVLFLYASTRGLTHNAWCRGREYPASKYLDMIPYDIRLSAIYQYKHDLYLGPDWY